tara:strand:- start:47 stop:754 length:708 start_codon:yes stop_codon:yes gene_type:complete
MTLNEYLNAPAGTEGVSGLRTDPQGRMIPGSNTVGGPTTRAEAFPDYEREVERAQARLSERDIRPGERQQDRDTRIQRDQSVVSEQAEGMSFDDAKRRAKGILAERNVQNPSASQVNALAISIQQGEAERLTDLELKRDLTQSRIDTVDAQLAQAGIVPSAPPVVDPETGVITQEYSDGTTRFKGVGRSPSGGGFDLDGFVSGDEDSKASDFTKGEIREQDGIRYQFDGKNWNQI